MHPHLLCSPLPPSTSDNQSLNERTKPDHQINQCPPKVIFANDLSGVVIKCTPFFPIYFDCSLSGLCPLSLTVQWLSGDLEPGWHVQWSVVCVLIWTRVCALCWSWAVTGSWPFLVMAFERTHSRTYRPTFTARDRVR